MSFCTRALQAVGLGSALLALAAPAFAQSIDPDSVTRTIQVGETITINKTITLGATGATNVDVFFLADNTGSMGGLINSAKAGASAILDALPASYRYGVGRYLGDPSEFGETPASAYTQLTAMTGNKTTVQTGINSWFASGGGDFPEGNYYALQQVAQTADWRPAAQRVVVWFGDATSHTETTTQADAISALEAAGAKVVAFNSSSAGSGIDGSYFGEPAGTQQASDIVDAVGGNLVNNFFGAALDDFVEAVTSEITDAASFIDLVFDTDFAGTGLSLSFTCTDVLGCNDVGGGESRTFQLSITGLQPGTYTFNAFARGVDAYEFDTITVVPEPSTYALLLAGLAVVAGVARRRGTQRR
jgi:hypothetical protein